MSTTRNDTISRPMVGVPFEVNPSSIDWSLFKRKRGNERQEKVRKFILEAKADVERYPWNYNRPFYTLLPEKTWYDKKMGELIGLAFQLGHHMTTRYELGLEFAQRLTNGETWEDLCEKSDTIPYYRLIDFGSGRMNNVGGCSEHSKPLPPTYGIDGDGVYEFTGSSSCSAPSVVIYDLSAAC